jgi:hypothetical protein
MDDLFSWTKIHITEIMNALALVALALSAYQLHAARQQTKSLELIGDSLTTRYIGEFPDFYAFIIATMSDAKKSVKMIYDLPAYACFSRSTEWLMFEHQLALLAHRKVDIKMAFYAAERRRRMLREQFAYQDNGQWLEWTKEDAIAEKFENFKRMYGRKSSNISDVNGFLELLDKVHDDTAEDFSHLYDAAQISSHISLYAWIIDDKTAIFVIPSYTKEHSEYGFTSKDARVVAALSTMIDRTIAQNSAQEAPEA